MKVKSTSAIMAFIAATLFGLQTVNAQTGSWKLAGNNLAGTEKLGSTNNAALHFITSNKTRMTLTGTGSLGINTSAPKAILHVFDGSAGTITDFSTPSLIVEKSTNCYINLRSPSVSESGILFGNPLRGSADGGIIYNSSSNFNGLQFRTNGNITQMTLTKDGNLGVGTSDPLPYKTKISHGSFGLDIERTSTGDDWEFFTDGTVSPDGSVGNLQLFFNNFPRGTFSSTSGAYTSISDERLKTNIKPMGAMLEKIRQLKPATYQFKNATDKQEYSGFIAQDVMKLFPAMVAHTVIPERKVDVYTMDYSQFGVLAIKGVQELQPVIEEQKQVNEEQNRVIEEQRLKIVTLEDRLAKLEATLATGAANKNGNVSNVIANASLDQNIPNPLTNSTSIRYNVPAGSSKAQLIVTDNNGNTIKQIQLNSKGNGLVNIETSTLSSGTYSYTLIVDGKTIETKKMVIVR